MTYRVVLLRRAEEDTNAIYVWLAKRSVAGAGRWYRAFLDAAASLSNNPSRCWFSAGVRGRWLRYTAALVQDASWAEIPIALSGHRRRGADLADTRPRPSPRNRLGPAQRTRVVPAAQMPITSFSRGSTRVAAVGPTGLGGPTRGLSRVSQCRIPEPGRPTRPVPAQDCPSRFLRSSSLMHCCMGSGIVVAACRRSVSTSWSKIATMQRAGDGASSGRTMIPSLANVSNTLVMARTRIEKSTPARNANSMLSPTKQ